LAVDEEEEDYYNVAYSFVYHVKPANGTSQKAENMHNINDGLNHEIKERFRNRRFSFTVQETHPNSSQQEEPACSSEKQFSVALKLWEVFSVSIPSRSFSLTQSNLVPNPRLLAKIRPVFQRL
jgi:hypothetical protein